jgi:hypothetical protein
MRLFLEAMAIYSRAWLGAFQREARHCGPAYTMAHHAVAAVSAVYGRATAALGVSGPRSHLFPAFRRQQIRQPVFVLGVPRSGTTFLHRALAADAAFTTTRTWELLFAPSLCQRYLIRGLIAVDSSWGRLSVGCCAGW